FQNAEGGCGPAPIELGLSQEKLTLFIILRFVGFGPCHLQRQSSCLAVLPQSQKIVGSLKKRFEARPWGQCFGCKNLQTLQRERGRLRAYEIGIQAEVKAYGHRAVTGDLAGAGLQEERV